MEASDLRPLNSNVKPLQISSLGSVFYRVGRSNEDRYKLSLINDDIRMYAVFDGHGGSATANYLRDYLDHYLALAFTGINPDDPEQVKKALNATFLTVDKKMLDLEFFDGSTAAIVLVTPRHIYLVSTGDSRAIIYSYGILLGQSQDSKPGNTNERMRITQLGGNVYGNPPRVMGRLAVSRAFGDFDLKIKRGSDDYDPEGFVSVIPQIDVFIRPDNAYLLVASDGLWDVVNSSEAAEFHTNDNKAQNLIELALSRLRSVIGIDDITIINERI